MATLIHPKQPPRRPRVPFSKSLLFAQSGIEQMREPDACFLQLLADNRVFAATRTKSLTTAYRCNAVRRTMILRIDEIAVPPRGDGVPDFERDRMLIVLDAIRRDATLPPIEVVEAISDAYSHRLYDGRHRLAASIAVGFSLVPAVIVRDLDEIKRAEAMAPS
jgi:hypothetical protein